MTNVIKDEVNRTIIRVLEDWAMMLVDRSDDALKLFSIENPFFISTIDFKGLVSGSYTVVCQEGFANTLACNLLGTEQKTEEGELKDALKEMINVLSGNLLTSSYGEEEVFDLTEPQVYLFHGHNIEKFFSQQTFVYLADNEPVMLSFSLGV